MRAAGACLRQRSRIASEMRMVRPALSRRSSGFGRHRLLVDRFVAECIVGRRVRLVASRGGRTKVPPLHKPRHKSKRLERGRGKVPPPRKQKNRKGRKRKWNIDSYIV